jgi:hypothetical protein
MLDTGYWMRDGGFLIPDNRCLIPRNWEVGKLEGGDAWKLGSRKARRLK